MTSVRSSGRYFINTPMQSTKKLPLSTLAAGLMLLAGCTTNSTTNANVVENTNTNTAVTTNANEANDNTNVAVVDSNENTNTEQGSEVDTSGWLTYTNEEYGFSFRYPSDWGEIKETSNFDGYNGLALLFSNRENATSEYPITPTISITKGVYADDHDNDNLPNFDYSVIDFTKTDNELSQILKRSGAISDTVTKTKINNLNAVEIKELLEGFTGKKISRTFFVIPHFNDYGMYFIITINGPITNELLTFNDTIEF